VSRLTAKKYGIRFSPPRKAIFEREPQHRHKATLNQAIEYYFPDLLTVV